MKTLSALSHFWIAVGAGLILGAVSVRLSPFHALGLIVGAMLAYVFVSRPEIALLVFLLFTSTILSSRQIPSFSLGFGTLYVTDLLLLCLLGLIVVRALAEPRFRIVRTPLDWPVLLFVGAWILSGFAAVWDGRMPFDQTLGEIRTVLSYLTFFCVTNLVRQRRQLLFLRQGLIVLGVFVALAMVAQYLLGTSHILVAGRVENLARSEGIANVDATRIIPPGQSIIVVAFMILIIGLIMGTDRYRLGDVWRFSLCGLLGLAILLTFFRASWVTIGLTLSMMVFQVWRQNKQRMLELGISAILGIALIVLVFQVASDAQMSRLSLAFTQRFGTLFRSETYEASDSSLRWRDFEYELAVPQFLSRPLLGMGPGAYYRPFVLGKDYEGNILRDWVHNAHLWILLKSGLLGYAGILWLSAVFLWRGFMLWRRIPDLKLRGMVLACTVTYVGTLIVSIVEPYLVIEHWTPVIGIMMGMNEVAFRLAATQKDEAIAETHGVQLHG